MHRPESAVKRGIKTGDRGADTLLVDVILRVGLMKLSELGGHRRVTFGEFLDRKVVCLVVGEPKVVLGADQGFPGFL